MSIFCKTIIFSENASFITMLDVIIIFVFCYWSERIWMDPDHNNSNQNSNLIVMCLQCQFKKNATPTL